jgi:hypothetical protein
MRLPNVEKGWWVKGFTTGRGVVVLTTEYVAFIPTERPKNLGVELAWGAAGFIEVGAKKVAPEQLIAKIGEPPKRGVVDELVRALSGKLWSAADAQPHEHRIPLRRSKRGLWFQRAGESIRLARTLPAEEVGELQAQLPGWTWA